MSALLPSDDDAVLPVAIGTAAWVIAFVITLAARPALDDGGHGWWVRVALAGSLLGIAGSAFLVWRRARRADGRTSQE